jgi:hypothetical protein
MKTLNWSRLVLISALLAMGESAYGQQPPDVVTSDSYYNTASGTGALQSLVAGFQNGGNTNTAAGWGTLHSNRTGSTNTASGFAALYNNTTGNNNAALGALALDGNTTGYDNTAVGNYALDENGVGYNNTATGYWALYSNLSGHGNTALGYYALFNNVTASNNIALGYLAGYYLSTGSNNIDIGNVGLAAESNTIRIGTKGTHKITVIAGIYGTPVTGAAVVVSATGRLGVTVSSERFKTGIAPMGSNTMKLGQLRPVTFHLKTDPKGVLQYGLIAEEVAKVYPELVIRNESGRIDGVRYDELAPMLLNEVQQQAAEIRELKQQQKATAAHAEQLRDVQQQLAVMQATFAKLQVKDELVARR